MPGRTDREYNFARQAQRTGAADQMRFKSARLAQRTVAANQNIRGEY